MALKLKFENPDFPKDHVFGVNGLGLFENGKEREVYADEEEAFLNMYTMIDDDGNVVKSSVKELFANNPHVSVSASGKANKRPEETEETTEGTEKGGES